MKYIANPVEVDAFKITAINGDDTGPIIVDLENGKSEIASKAMTSRYFPQIGDYWVIQADGYAYLNPKDVFERKYRAA